MSLGHENGPSSAAAFALANERLAGEDAKQRDFLDRYLERERDPSRAASQRTKAAITRARTREIRRQRHYAQTTALDPFWPSWAKPLCRETDLTRCAACPREIMPHNTSGICGKCLQKAGRAAVRLVLALRNHRAKP